MKEGMQVEFGDLQTPEIAEKEVEKTREHMAEEVMQLVREQFEQRTQVGRGKAANVWTGELPSFRDGVCIKTPHDTSISVNTLEKEFKIHQQFLRAGVRVPRPMLYVKQEHPDSSQPSEALAMEHIDGETLHDMLARMVRENEQFSVEEFVALAEDIQQQISKANEARLFHRDLHDENIVISKKNRQAYLIDFGDSVELLGSSDPDDAYEQAQWAQGGKIMPGKFLRRDEQILIDLRREVVAKKLIKRNS